MAIPMPLYERFAVGTRWVLKGDCVALKAGSMVTILEAPYEEINEMYVRVQFGKKGEFIVPLSLLG